ncbi:MAG: carboxylesterase/lipase family protein [Bacteroidales bacterium]|nr:carboxylesterase/lipase family protein [Candidatus Cryptobacteroides caccocaballi]
MKRSGILISVALAATMAWSCGQTQADDNQLLLLGDDIAIAQTQYGKVQGYIYNDVYHFLGIPYGASTEGKNRFMPPVAPEPWDGVLRTICYGDSAPQGPANFDTQNFGYFRDHWNYGFLSEDCLRLNVWTPALDGKKRPVIVWLHGGGYSSGNGVEQDGYTGGNFAGTQDAVFCSVNHRLNAFGYCDLAGVGGEKYKHSGNVGMLDIIAALQWVHDNIENFGGDPGNVTIIGQSGGGSKVCTVAAMPAAKGLIHKAVALSGNSTSASNKEAAEMLGAAVLEEAGLKAADIDKLQEMPWEEFLAIANRAASKLSRQGLGMRFGYSPVGDDVDIPSGTFYTSGRTDVPDVPMILCSTSNEFVSSATEPELEKKTKEEIVEMIAARVPENAEAIYDEYAKLFPDETPFGIWSVFSSSRDGVFNTATAKLQQDSPVYVAWFRWMPELFSGRMRAFHCLDICFWFNNTDLMYTHTGGSKEARALSTKMAESLAAFMRTGNPDAGNKKGLPHWGQFTPENGETMTLDNEPYFGSAPDAAARALMKR